ncbi:hypothetical protein POUND7_003121 [Theobroma cacao]
MVLIHSYASSTPPPCIPPSHPPLPFPGNFGIITNYLCNFSSPLIFFFVFNNKLKENIISVYSNHHHFFVNLVIL